VRSRLALRPALAGLAWAAPVLAGTVLAFPSGGYFVTEWGAVSIALLALLAVAALALDGLSIGGRPGLLAVGGLVGLAAWQGISSAWAFDPSLATEAMNRTLLYAGAFALALIGVRAAHDLGALLVACLAGALVVCAYALGSRLLPSVVSGDEVARLSNPITYWNGLGAIAAFGVILAVGIASSPGRNAALRYAASAMVPAFLLTLLLTYSRGAAAVLLVSAVILIAVAPARLETVAVLVLTLAVSVPLLLSANGDDAIAGVNGVLPPHGDAGRTHLLALLLTMAGSAIVGWLTATGIARLPADGRRWAARGVAVCSAALIIGALIAWSPDGGRGHWVQQQFESFKSFDVAARNDARSVSDRLAVAAGSGRWQNWDVAVQEFESNPIVGTGAGDYRFVWQERRDIDLTVTNAHSAYLETLGESGLVGLLLLLAPVGIAAWLAASYLPRVGAAGRDVGVALSAAAVIGLHAAGDWDWQLPAIVLPAIALGAGAIKVMALHRGAGPAGLATRAGLAAVAVVGILLVAGPTMAADDLNDARDLAREGDLAGALDRSRDASRLSPQDASARLLEANILSDLNRPSEADAAFAAAVARSPRDWRTFADWAAALADRGDAAAARLAARRAIALNPLELRPRLILEGLRP